MRLFIFFRDIVWTSVFSVATVVASITFAILGNQTLPLPLAISAVAFAVLSSKAK